jgi:hypothetical protein
VRLSHQDDWLKLDRTAGSIPPGGTDTLHVLFDARQYKDGDYAGEVRIESNDVQNPLLTVPCAMHVGVLAEPAEAQPGAVGVVSQSPLVRFAFTPPAAGAALVPGTFELNGTPVRLAGELSHEPDGRAVVTLRAVDLLAVLSAGEAQAATLSAEFEPGGWLAATGTLAVTPPSMAGRLLPAFGSGEPTRTFRGQEAIDVEWIPPEGGADRYDIAYSGDGGVRWTVVGSGARTSFAFIVPDTTSQAMMEIVARRGDAVVATFLTAPFIVDLEAIGAGPEPPRAFGLRLAGASPARGSIRLSLDLPQPGDAVAEVYDIRGARVRTLVRGALVAGRHALVWDGRRDDGGSAAPGVYLVRAMRAGEARVVRVAMLR